MCKKKESWQQDGVMKELWDQECRGETKRLSENRLKVEDKTFTKDYFHYQVICLLLSQ